MNIQVKLHLTFITYWQGNQNVGTQSSSLYASEQMLAYAVGTVKANRLFFSFLLKCQGYGDLNDREPSQLC